ncbi:putative membrane protein [Thermomonospora echinospora]|uniref:Putative membrane protein n=1 Tax=Thermomonospora echinospora TaxID=1992 RepID=A0A1H5XLW6_9ACTN|nr:PH domain-containing protein [Thermomonospora echinospora]SEG12367.1 putative membrane protein [Thermomonospora echinospora]
MNSHGEKTGGRAAARPPGTPPGTPPPAGRTWPVAARLHPLTFVAGAIRELLALLVAGAAGLAVNGLSTAFYFALVGLGFGFLFHMAKWATFTYTVHDDRIELRRALIGRSVKTVPRERIRGVDIRAPLTHRLLRLAIVQFDAGSEGGDGELNAVSRAEAERLRDLLMRGDGPRPRPAASGAPDGPVVLARARPRWYLFAPLSGAYLFTPFALAGSLLGALYNLGDDLGLIDGALLARLGGDVAGLPRPAFVALAVAFVAAMPVASVVVFALLNWDFTLRATAGGRGRDGAALVAERGLITRRSVTLERRRIRGVELADNPFERAAGVVHLGALVTGLDDTAHRGSLLPASPRPVAFRVAARVLGGPVPGPLVPHPPAARGRRLVRAVAPPLALAVPALLAGRLWAVYAALLMAALAVPLGLDRYRQLGHATDGTRLVVRSGSLRRRRVVIEHRAVVAWRLRQTLFQRRLGLATLTVGVGAGEGGYPAIDMGEHDAVAFAHGITPGWVAPFLEDGRD